MKLILKQYLASLKERDELDAILPDLLSQMGLNVFISPTRGFKEYGVDIAAVGRINDDIEKVYLFSVKSGNLTRSTWGGNTNQALRPSIDEIFDAFVPSRIPPEHKEKPVVICLCFGGDVSSGIRQEVTGYTDRNSTDSISFQEWNGDKLAELLMVYMFQQELLPDNWQSTLRKSLALLNEPVISHKHFQHLVKAIFSDTSKEDQISVALNQVNLCLWVLFTWCRDESNLESAYLSAEYSLLNSWDNVKEHTNNSRVKKAFESIVDTYHLITDSFLDKCLIPFVGIKHGVSHGISSSCSIDLNLKLFDFLGRLAMKGQWLLFQLTQSHNEFNPEHGENSDQITIRNRLEKITESIKLLVKNNPLLLSPYKDSQAIDLTLSLHLLSQNSKHDRFVIDWLEALIDRSSFSYAVNGMYPCDLDTYEQLLEHKNEEMHDQTYKHKITRGSILYPILAVFCGIHKAEKQSDELNSFSEEHLNHCTLQYVSPNISTEENLYSNSSLHGTATANFPLTLPEALMHASQEIFLANEFKDLSAVRKGYMPIVLLACRYYRYPVPLHFLSDLIDDVLKESSEE
jgi:hypothetical protein